MSDSITKSSDSFMYKFYGILIITSLLMIPTFHIDEVIEERQRNEQNAKQELAAKWSEHQVAGAVVLSIPMIENLSHQNTLHFLPENLEINADVKNITKKSGIYEVPLYETRILMSGSFSDVSAKVFETVDTTINWNKANLSLGVLELRGLKSLDIKWNGKTVASEVGDMPSGIIGSARTVLDGAKEEETNLKAPFVGSAVIAKITPDKKLKQEGKGEFSIEMVLRGSERIEFYPFAQTTTVTLTSTEETPTFQGVFLPEKYGVKDNKFHAEWKILGMNRNLPKYWTGDKSFLNEINNSSFGVGFNGSEENYELNALSNKYTLLFIALTFITLISLEVILKFRFHLVHYAMTGTALIVFYYLLLSFSEQIGFGLAYGLAAVATIFSISIYVFRITKVRKSTWIVCSQLGLLYSFLYGLLKIEDFQFAFEATGLWIIVAALMYATIKIDWFNFFKDQSKKQIVINNQE
ncbi:MAG: cell envelope integrity protein CreD [Candidatus Poribacteria bacterium]|nr:cell envelope integrity protein CreD [Candidatus Poribacteria bacterium]